MGKSANENESFSFKMKKIRDEENVLNRKSFTIFHQILAFFCLKLPLLKIFILVKYFRMGVIHTLWV